MWNIPARLTEFTGRDGLLAELSAALQLEGRAVVQAVTGMGGVGKTTTAIEYAYRHRNELDIAWWVPSEDPTLIPDRLAELACALDLAATTDSAETAVARLRGVLYNRGRWLIVFDNAEDPRAVAPILPDGPGQVLVTSRNPRWHNISATTVKVREFTRTESVALLRLRAPELDEPAADQVADALGDLPLAVDQAGHLLADTSIDAHGYLRLLAERADRLLDHDPRGAYPASVAASWAVAFDRLAADDPSALELLSLVAWLAPEPMPLSLLAEKSARSLPAALAVTADDALVLARCTALLQSRGMSVTTPNSVQLHRVPAALLRARSRADIVGTHGWPVTVVRLLRDALPGDIWNNPPQWAPWRVLLPHVLAATSSDRNLGDVSEEVAWLLDRAATYMHSRGEPRAALPLYQRAYMTMRDRLGSDHIETLTTARHLAGDLYALGEYKQARTLMESTLEKCRLLLGDDHPLTLSVAVTLGSALIALNEFQQAKMITEDALVRRRQIFGADHPGTLKTATTLANVLYNLDEYQRARILDEDTLIRSRRVLGDDHPDTLTSASNLAVDLRKMGDHQQACALHGDTFTRRRRVLGEDHPDTLASGSNLAVDLRLLGEHEQARALQEDILVRWRRVLGEDHPDTLASGCNLAVDLSLLGEHEQARALFEETLARRRRVLGDEHPATLLSATHLADELDHMGELGQADKWRSWACRTPPEPDLPPWRDRRSATPW